MNHPLRILGISGSLRKTFFDTAALLTVREFLPEGSGLEIFDLAAIAMYNEDVKEKNS